MKLKKNDLVMVTTGRDKGRQGKIEKIFSDTESVLVLGINQYKKHRKSQGEGKPGDILTLDRPIKTSKVAIICPKCKQQTRVGFTLLNDQKTRVCRKCDERID